MTHDEFYSIKAELGWSASRTACELCVSNATVWRYLSGRSPIPGPVARLMALFLQSHLVLRDEESTLSP